MTESPLENQIQEAIPKLFEIARNLTGNKISENCKIYTDRNQRQQRKFS